MPSVEPVSTTIASPTQGSAEARQRPRRFSSSRTIMHKLSRWRICAATPPSAWRGAGYEEGGDATSGPVTSLTVVDTVPRPVSDTQATREPPRVLLLNVTRPMSSSSRDSAFSRALRISSTRACATRRSASALEWATV